jgi:P4 family phage/plasmid primase-like protien
MCAKGYTTLKDMAHFIPEQLKPLTLYEPVNEAKLSELLGSPDLLSRISQKHEDPDKRGRNLYVLLSVYKEIARNSKGRPVRYDYAEGAHDGRVYAKKVGGVSLQGVDKVVRRSIAEGELRDIDIKLCHPTIYSQFLDKCGRPCPMLKEYTLTSKEVRSRMCELYKIDMNTAKQTMLAITYGGALKVRGTDQAITDDFVKRYSEEMRANNRYVSSLFPDRLSRCQEKKNPEPSCASQVVGCIENGILKVMYDMAVAMKMGPSVLVFDGLMVKKLNDTYIKVTEAAILDRTGYSVQLEEKPIEPVSLKELHEMYPPCEEEAVEVKVTPIIPPEPRRKRRRAAEQEDIPLDPELAATIELINGNDVGLADLVAKLRGKRLKNVAGDDQRCKFYAYNTKLTLYDEVDRSYVLVEEISRPLKTFIEQTVKEKRYNDRVRYLTAVMAECKESHNQKRRKGGGGDPRYERAEKELAELQNIGKVYKSLSSTSKLVSILKLVMSTCRDMEFEAKLDANPHMLAVRNGIVDLRTGVLRPRVEEDYVTRVVDMDYDPQHPGLPLVVELVDQITLSTKLGRPEYMQYIQRLLGYTITGLTCQQVVVFCIGNGANGKGVLEDLVRRAMGPYHYAAPPDIIRAGGKSSAGAASPHIADCYKKRVAWLDELPDCLIDQQLFKSMSGGAQITARHLYGNNTTFDPTHTLFVNSNHMPRMKLDAYSLRRVVCMPFDMEARYEDDADPEMRYNPENPRHVVRNDHLLDNFPWEAALTWMVQGAVAYYEGGLGKKPACCEAKQDEFKAENDKLAQFIEERCQTGNIMREDGEDDEGNTIYVEFTRNNKTVPYSVLASKFLTKYNAFRKNNRLGEVKAKALVREMEAKGFVHCKSKVRDDTRDRFIFEGITYNGMEYE